MPNASPARCWARPKSCPSGLARATVCGWKPGFASTAMTWTRPPIRWKPISLWSIGKRRKKRRDFPGRRNDHGQAARTARRRKRVGIRPDGRAPAREGTEIADKTGRVIGKITSGGFGPSLNAPVAMGYVESAFAADGTKLDLMVRGKALPARVAPMPFVPHRYKRRT